MTTGPSGGTSATSRRTTSIPAWRDTSSSTSPLNTSRSTARAPPAGTAARSSGSRRLPRRRSSAFRRPAAESRRTALSELEHTSSARRPPRMRRVIVPGRISYSRTRIPGPQGPGRTRIPQAPRRSPRRSATRSRSPHAPPSQSPGQRPGPALPRGGLSSSSGTAGAAPHRPVLCSNRACSVRLYRPSGRRLTQPFISNAPSRRMRRGSSTPSAGASAPGVAADAASASTTERSSRVRAPAPGRPPP